LGAWPVRLGRGGRLMAKQGRKFLIHGAFKSKARAKSKHKRVRNSWIIKRRVRGHTRYVVLSRKR
jgi:hypothetical protein